MKFVTLSNSFRFKFLRWQAETIGRFHPKDKYVIYDIGLESREIDELKALPHVTLKSFADIGESFFSSFDMFPDSLMRADGGKALITRSSAKKTWILQAELEDYNEMVYLDADAFLCRDLGNIFHDDFNVCVTLRRQFADPINPLEDPKSWHFKLFNAGVQFFKGEKLSLNAYFEEFKTLLMEMPNLSDQGNLNRFATKYAGFLFTEMNKSYKIKVREQDLIFRVIPCSLYNRLVNPGGNIDRVFIAHVKGLSKNKMSGTYKDILKHFKR